VAGTLRISVERAALLIKTPPVIDNVIKDERTSIQLREVVEETIEMMRSAFRNPSRSSWLSLLTFGTSPATQQDCGKL